MQRIWTRWMSPGVAAGTLMLLAIAGTATAGDDGPGSGLRRLFHLGGGSSSDESESKASPSPSRLPYGGATYNPPMSTRSNFGNTLPPGGASVGAKAPISSFGGNPRTPPVSSPNAPTERITPRSRVSKAITNADPVLTRFALGRSNDGSTFGMFLQIFADGTVVDSEGVHHLRPSDLRPVFEAVQSGDLYRVKGHCGAPSTDFIEYVHIVVYERRLGRLQAHPFSYSGNPQGCEHIVRHLHIALENLQAKLSRSASATSMTGNTPTAPSPTAPTPMAASPSIPLSPATPGH